MGKLFKDNSKAFRNYAKQDYDMLNTAFGDDYWNLIDSSKHKVVNSLKGGLVCYCYIIDQIIYTESS